MLEEILLARKVRFAFIAGKTTCFTIHLGNVGVVGYLKSDSSRFYSVQASVVVFM